MQRWRIVPRGPRGTPSAAYSPGIARKPMRAALVRCATHRCTRACMIRGEYARKPAAREHLIVSAAVRSDIQATRCMRSLPRSLVSNARRSDYQRDRAQEPARRQQRVAKHLNGLCRALRASSLMAAAISRVSRMSSHCGGTLQRPSLPMVETRPSTSQHAPTAENATEHPRT